MKLVTSNFVNYINLENDCFAVFHAYYGNLKKINRAVYNLIEFFKEPNEINDFINKYKIADSQKNQVEGIVNELLNKKFLLIYNEELDEFNNIQNDPELYGYDERMLRFYVTPNCNMKCSYCFEGNHSPGLNITLQTIIDGLYAYKAFLNKEKDQNFNVIKVNFFGGEPLLKFELIKEAYPYIFKILDFKEKQIKVTINTNATLLDKEKIDWIINHGINLLVSIDGMKEHHDENRIFKDGTGTFDTVIRNLKLLIERSTEDYIKNKLSILVTISDKNISSLNEIIDYLYELGLKNVSLNAAFSCAVGKEKTDAWTLLNEAEIDLFIHNVIELRNKMYKKDFHIGGMWGYIPQRMIKGGVTFCQALGYEIGISPKRELYTCPCNFGKDETTIGKLSDRNFEFNENYLKWKNRTVFNTPHCNKCEISGICRGGCPGVSVLNNESIYNPRQCEFWKKFIISYIKIVVGTVEQ